MLKPVKIQKWIKSILPWNGPAFLPRAYTPLVDTHAVPTIPVSLRQERISFSFPETKCGLITVHFCSFSPPALPFGIPCTSVLGGRPQKSVFMAVILTACT